MQSDNNLMKRKAQNTLRKLNINMNVIQALCTYRRYHQFRYLAYTAKKNLLLEIQAVLGSCLKGAYGNFRFKGYSGFLYERFIPKLAKEQNLLTFLVRKGGGGGGGGGLMTQRFFKHNSN